MTERALPVTVLEPAGIDPELLDHSLSLRFDLGQFDPRITFTRNSSATYFGSDGLLKTAAANEPRIDHDPVTGECKGFLVEERRTNLLTYSEQFDSAAWVKFEASIATNTSASPDGLISADKLIESTVSNRHFVYQNVSVTSGTSYTYSVFVKPAGRSVIRIDAGDGHFGAGNYAEFNLASKTATAFGNCTASIVESSNGYLHCRCTFIATASASSAFTIETHNGTSVSYAGDGTSGVYIWGAQLEAGSFPTSYIPTPAVFTSRNSTATYFDSTGVMKTAAINEPRYDHGFVNGQWVSKGLVLENSATNLATNSENLSASVGSSLLIENAVAPDGAMTMDRVVETNTTGEHYPQDYIFTPTAGVTYTWSCFAKRPADGAERLLLMRIAAGNLAAVYFSVTNGVASSPGAPQYVAHGSEYIGNGIYRFWITWVAANATNTVCRTQIASPTNGISYTGDGVSGLFIWGRQLEAASHPSSYIKTEASQVTRAADLSTSSQVTRVADNAVMTGTNFSSWYRQGEGTIFCEAAPMAAPLPNANGKPVVQFRSEAGVDWVDIRYRPNKKGGTGVVLANAFQADISTVADYDAAKGRQAVAYANNNTAATFNGEAVSLDSEVTIPTNLAVASIGWGNITPVGSRMFNGTIQRIAYYPRRLTNDQLVALTK